MNRPNSRNRLDNAIRRAAGLDEAFVAARTVMADAVVAQMLPDGAVKGGSALKIRFGDAATRFTDDLDTARESSIEEYADGLSRALRAGWEGGGARRRSGGDENVLPLRQHRLRNDIENRIPRLKERIPSFISSSVDEINDEIKLDIDHALVLSVMEGNPTATYPQMASITGFSESKVYRIATALRKKGVVDRVGSRKSGVWKITYDK